MSGTEVVDGLSNMGFHPPRLTWLQPLLCAPSASSKGQYFVPSMAPFPGVGGQPPLPGGRLSTLDHFCFGRDSTLFLLEQTLNSGYGSTFLTCNDSSKTIICGLIECIMHHHGIYTALLLSEELTSLQMQCCSEPRLMELTELTMLPIILKQLA